MTPLRRAAGWTLVVGLTAGAALGGCGPAASERGAFQPARPRHLNACAAT